MSANNATPTVEENGPKSPIAEDDPDVLWASIEATLGALGVSTEAPPSPVAVTAKTELPGAPTAAPAYAWADSTNADDDAAVDEGEHAEGEDYDGGDGEGIEGAANGHHDNGDTKPVTNGNQSANSSPNASPRANRGGRGGTRGRGRGSTPRGRGRGRGAPASAGGSGWDGEGQDNAAAKTTGGSGGWDGEDNAEGSSPSRGRGGSRGGRGGNRGNWHDDRADEKISTTAPTDRPRMSTSPFVQAATGGLLGRKVDPVVDSRQPILGQKDGKGAPQSPPKPSDEGRRVVVSPVPPRTSPSQSPVPPSSSPTPPSAPAEATSGPQSKPRHAPIQSHTARQPDAALEAKLAAARARNAEIMQRRLAQEADELAFRREVEKEKEKEQERKKEEEERKKRELEGLKEQINERQANIDRKLKQASAREWDSGKNVADWEVREEERKRAAKRDGPKETGKGSEGKLGGMRSDRIEDIVVISGGRSEGGEWERGRGRGRGRGGRGGRGGGAGRGEGKDGKDEPSGGDSGWEPKEAREKDKKDSAEKGEVAGWDSGY
ncbi:hypothetical protein M427DRAFT_152854 [Gonapodya prolifera JEL478]|uniref:Uncharacterized protein n=1 Tax=Gonapodya prolifera (strain JEL478) TaxID=1344416 RepID=A0A139AQ59_GONPJ|nr:hypothetical protein M427DRAFT_152854 [Gonapodya prolifera JEL478]|eukprot:KXS18880.1 hypothetical protein M427DRAFT_152854 [Gonapodya prolifera JEL478]